MSTVHVVIEGTSPLLMNRFHDAAAEKAAASTSSAFNSRERGTPRQQAEPKLYTDEHGKILVPGPNIFRAIIDAGVFIKSGRKQLTTQKSSLVPAAMSIAELACPVTVPGRIDVPCEVDSRSVVIPATGGRVMAYRPRIDRWQIGFTLEVDTELFTVAIARQLVDDAGKRIGLGDFRPARKGPFGRLVVVKWKPEESAMAAS